MACKIQDLVEAPHRCIMQGYTDTPMTELQVGLMLTMIIGLPLYGKFEDPIPVGVIVALVGGLLFPSLPGRMQMIAWVVVFVGLAVGVFGAAYKGMVRA